MLARAHKRLCVQIVNEPTKPTIADHQESEATTTTTKTPTLAETFITPMMINLPVWVYKHQYRYKRIFLIIERNFSERNSILDRCVFMYDT